MIIGDIIIKEVTEIYRNSEVGNILRKLHSHLSPGSTSSESYIDCLPRYRLTYSCKSPSPSPVFGDLKHITNNIAATPA